MAIEYGPHRIDIVPPPPLLPIAAGHRSDAKMLCFRRGKRNFKFVQRGRGQLNQVNDPKQVAATFMKNKKKSKSLLREEATNRSWVSATS
jgi:hypothetical protein